MEDTTLTLSLAVSIGVVLLTAIFLWLRHKQISKLRPRGGCAPVRVTPSGRLHLLLIRSRKHPEVFTFPAGAVERGETYAQAAARETLEEAGVTGRLGRRLCEVRDEKTRTSLFVLHVEEERATWQEAHERERVWFDMGVPGSPAAKEAVARVRSTLSIKPTTQRLFEKVQAQSQMLAQECESFERKWARSKTKSAQPTRAAG
tara:strand:+ start:553 stop:1161 length:609 start_codon:yes stop_codon:yes gene_type:complete